MKATETRLLDFLKKSPQFVIPIYQRTYSWTERECRQLWADIVRTGSDDTVPAHFVGSIVYIHEGIYQVTTKSQLLVIDGQQRLTTVMLLLEALARQVGDDKPMEEFAAEHIRGYYLLNTLAKAERRFKLLLTQTDKQSLLALLQQKVPPADSSIRVTENFAFFEERLRDGKTDITAVCNGLAKLMIVDISLDRGHDNPQLIFESMNSTGRELTQADLIRNFVLMGLKPELQARLYEEYWRPMEVDFGQEAYGTHFDGFMRHYLTLKTGEIPKLRAVYEAFKGFARTPAMEARGIEHLVADIRDYAAYYCAMALGKEQGRNLKEAFHDLRELRVDVAYPLLLELYADYAHGTIESADFIRAVRLIEAYVFRRAVCAIPTNSLNTTFATFSRELHKDRYLASIQAHFLTMPSYRRFPGDPEFKRELCKRDLYNFRSRSYWLRRIENHGRKERVEVAEYTVEHIMPQNENLSGKWREALGSDWRQVHETWLHTLGNLTLTGYNAEYSDRPFEEKRDMQGGFRESPLRLNAGVGTANSWDVAAIQSRAKDLAERAVTVWPAPSLPAPILETFRQRVAHAAGYTLADHPQLDAGSPMRPLFDDFRKGVLSLNSCISEEVLKLYIAYKAETNFVDVIPLRNRLTLVLNMKFHELYDPRGIGKDVTNLGRWGNGDVEIAITDVQDLPYVLGLVRQAFERQMGNGGSEP